VHFVSALTGEGLPELMKAMVPALATAPEVAVPGPVKATRLPQRVARAGLVVEKKDWGFAVSGDRVEQLVGRTDLDSEGALARFQSELDRLGVNVALEAAGVEPGDTVRIADTEFEYQP
jgi:GTP-binding protein